MLFICSCGESRDELVIAFTFFICESETERQPSENLSFGRGGVVWGSGWMRTDENTTLYSYTTRRAPLLCFFFRKRKRERKKEELKEYCTIRQIVLR